MLTQELHPQRWQDYKYNDFQKSVLQKATARNIHPPAITLSGHTGGGKTSLASLYIKSTLCKNRLDGQIDPCGHCKICKTDARLLGSANNVIWVQQGNEDTITTQFNLAIAETFQPPNGMDEDHRFYKFIVIDELQSVPDNLIQRLLYSSEIETVHTQNKVIMIFITMNEEGIKQKTFKPLVDRTIHLRFRPFSDTQVFDFLKQKRPDVDNSALSIIAETAKGSLRSALSNLDICEQYDETLDPTVVADIMFYADATARAKLWTLMQEGNFALVKEYWDTLTRRVDPNILLTKMADDLENEMERMPNEFQYSATCQIFNYFVSNTVRPFDLVKVLMFKRLLDPKFVKGVGVSGYNEIFN